ncbi:MAG: chemotaxis protein CheZ [Alphaproteobacteria bacterium]|nr:MAG: chemotaxis protein CheZ [Alphaproteobacteria bacterium]
MATAASKMTLEERVEALSETHGQLVELGDIAGIVASLMQTMDGDVTMADLHLRDEIGDLVAYIERAKVEIASLQPHNLSKQKIPDASDELDAIVAATEDAAGKIMDAAEEIEMLAAKSRGKMAERLGEVATKIYEASSFQDITGQRVTKVVQTLRHLEEKLATLAEAIGDRSLEPPEDVVTDENGNVVNEKALLHGPQLPEEANSQDEIDALLASFDD